MTEPFDEPIEIEIEDFTLVVLETLIKEIRKYLDSPTKGGAYRLRAALEYVRATRLV